MSDDDERIDVRIHDEAHILLFHLFFLGILIGKAD